MRKMTYRPKKAGPGGLDAYSAAVASAGEGIYVTVNEIIGSVEAACREGCDYDDEFDMCVARA